MNYNKVSVNFHQTFKPESAYISSVLELASDWPIMSIEDISLRTGIPSGINSGKVEPHVLYSGFMGLISFSKSNGKFELKQTELGKEVSDQDPGLQETLTLILCHGMMLRRLCGASLWSATFRDVMPKYHGRILKDQLALELASLLKAPVSKKTLAPLLSSYSDMFSSINFISDSDDSIAINSIRFENDYIYLYAFLLFEYWDESFENQNEITSDDFTLLRFGKAFGWSEKEEYDVLERMNEHGLIRLNRQLMPYTILRLADKSYLIKKLYSELC